MYVVLEPLPAFGLGATFSPTEAAVEPDQFRMSGTMPTKACSSRTFFTAQGGLF